MPLQKRSISQGSALTVSSKDPALLVGPMADEDVAMQAGPFQGARDRGLNNYLYYAGGFLITILVSWAPKLYFNY